jgi:tRNA nucleotidyltransferase (CCA-adding enzyme)
MRGLPLVEQFSARLRLPNAQRDLALAVTRDHLLVHRAYDLRPSTLLELLERFGAFKRGDFFDNALDACLCDARGRLGQEQSQYPQVAFLRTARDAAAEVQAEQVTRDGIQGPAVGEELRKRRTQRLSALKQAREGQR